MNTIFKHRSIRKFKPTPVEDDKIERMITAASRASSTGNMQLYSIIVTSDSELKNELSPCHFNQPCVQSAPLVVTFCADINRFSRWCKLSNADAHYDNFAWFTASTIDTVIAAQNFALEAEHLGLGICYLGTTTYNAQEIIKVLNIPYGVIPVTTLVVGYPDQTPPLTDRLPLKAIYHKNRYTDYDNQTIVSLWSEKESLEEMKELVKINGTKNLAQIFTEKRYKKEDNLFFSEKYYNTLIQQGFINKQK